METWDYQNTRFQRQEQEFVGSEYDAKVKSADASAQKFLERDIFERLTGYFLHGMIIYLRIQLSALELPDWTRDKSGDRQWK